MALYDVCVKGRQALLDGKGGRETLFGTGKNKGTIDSWLGDGAAFLVREQPGESGQSSKQALSTEDQDTVNRRLAIGRGLHLSTFRLNLSAFCGMWVHFGDVEGVVSEVSGGMKEYEGVFRMCVCVRNGSG
jgi:hypothetical protein